MKLLTPPILWNVGRTFFYPKIKQFSGDYKTWAEAEALSTGYDDPLIFEKVKKATLKVKQGEAAYERDSVNFSRVEYSWPVLAGLLWITGLNRNKLCVLDFGGSLGSSYYQNRKFLAHLNSLRWCVVEQKQFVEFGEKELVNEHLKFYANLKECAAWEKPDVFLLSSVLPYLSKPYEVLETIAKLGPKYIIIDRTPFFAGTVPDRLTVQKVSPRIYDASYPAWFFNEKKFLDYLESGYELIAEFKAPEENAELSGATATYKGFLFRKHD